MSTAHPLSENAMMDAFRALRKGDCAEVGLTKWDVVRRLDDQRLLCTKHGTKKVKLFAMEPDRRFKKVRVYEVGTHAERVAPDTIAAPLVMPAVVSARRLADRKVMFHGTSSGVNGATLRSILKQGLITHAPKAWADDPDAEATMDQRSRASYGGVYLAENAGTALSSVHRPRNQSGDKSQYPVIVTCLVQQRDALPDEDDYTSAVDYWYSKAAYATNSEAYLLRMWVGMLLAKNVSHVSGDTDDVLRCAEDAARMRAVFRETAKASLRGKEALPHVSIDGLLDGLFDAETLRRVSKLSPTYYKRSAVPEARTMLGMTHNPETMSSSDAIVARQPTMGDGEAAFRAALDALMRATRRAAVGNNGAFSHTLRVMDDIGYAGRTRITSVVALPNYFTRKPIPGDPLQVVVYYGDAQPIVDYLKKEGYPVLVSTPAAVVEAAVVSASRLATRETMFHGTASGPGGSVLRSILKNGLITSAPKAWAEDSAGAYSSYPSLVPYGGIYLTDKLEKAFDSVERPRGDDKSQYPVIVTCLVQERDALPDEDTYTKAVDDWMKYAVPNGNSSSFLSMTYAEIELLERLDALTPEQRARVVEQGAETAPLRERFADDAMEWFDSRNALPTVSIRPELDALFDAEIVRRASKCRDPAWPAVATENVRALLGVPSGS